MQVTSAEQASRMRRALEDLAADVGEFLNSESPLPRAGSRAAHEMADSRLAKSLLNAFQVGGLMLEAAADHAFALTRLLVEPVPTVAPWTCARGALEASALSCWLLAADISSRERAARGFAYRHATLREQQKLARSINDQPAFDRIAARIDEVEGTALALGLSRVVDKNDRRIGIGRVMPSTTDLVEEVFRQETLYRIFSAMAHSQSTAMVRLGFVPFDASLPTLLTKSMNSDVAAVLLTSGADSLAHPVWAKARLFGLDCERLVKILEARYGEMGLAGSKYFWRHEACS